MFHPILRPPTLPVILPRMGHTDREVFEAYGVKPPTQTKLRMLNRTKLDKALERGEGKKALKEFDSDERKRVAVESYKKKGTLADCARSAGVPRSTVERWVVEDPAFRESMIDAHEEVIDSLERAALRRAKGTREIPGSDDLLKFLLRANRPGKFAAASGAGGSGSVAEQRRQEEEQMRSAMKQKFLVGGQEIEF